jgi:ketosteroid isomerase-like protein
MLATAPQQEFLNVVRIDWRFPGEPPMSMTRAYAEEFFDAMMTRDPAQIARFIADDAEWLIVGPIELFPYCGQHLGKEAVLDAYGRMSASVKLTAFTRDYAITDGESASALSRMTNVDLATGRQIVVRLAQFARFRDGKVCEFCSITDTLGAAEQFMGRSLSQMAEDAPALAEI